MQEGLMRLETLGFLVSPGFLGSLGFPEILDFLVCPGFLVRLASLGVPVPQPE